MKLLDVSTLSIVYCILDPEKNKKCKNWLFFGT